MSKRKMKDTEFFELLENAQEAFYAELFPCEDLIIEEGVEK